MNRAFNRKRMSRAALCLLSVALCVPFLLLSMTHATPTPAPPPPPLPNTGLGNPTEQNAQPAQPPSLHQWGAVTLFHGLPSDRVRAVAQDTEGVMWFGTDAGLARYDGRRTQTVNAEGLPQGRVLALKLDQDGALWVGTEGGATRLSGGEFRAIAETNGIAVTSIITPERGRALMTSEGGVIFDCTVRKDDSLGVRPLPAQPLLSADVDHPGPLNLTALAFNGGTLHASSLSRGLLTVEGDAFKEVQSRPRAYFIQAVEEDAQGTLWFGAKAKKDEGGLYQSGDALHPLKVAAETGTVLALRADAAGGMWVGTEAHGAFHYSHNSRLIEHFTFDGTAGGLRSDHIYSIFIDREDVVWFGTDKGVCRYDPHALRVENISDERESNFARTIYRTNAGRLLCGTNNGLFIRDDASNAWRPLSDLSHKIIYAITEAPDGRLLIGTANGLYAASIQNETPASDLRFTRIGPEDASDDNSQQSNNSVRAIALFRGAIYIAAFGRGVERLDGSKLSQVWPTADQRDARLREVVSLHAEGAERLWMGTASAGVFLFDGQTAQTLPALANLNGAAVWSIDGGLGGDAAVWLATARGLYLYGSGQLKQLVTNTDARGVIAIKTDDNSRPRAWCATAGGGLLKIFMDQQFGPLISRLDAEQGLPSQSVFAILPERTLDAGKTGGAAGDESLLIGTTRGIARYEAGHIEPTLTPTRIISKRIHQPEELRAGLRLEYPQNSLVLDVTATSSRTFPEQFQYGFLLYDGAGRLIKQKLSHDAQLTMEGLRPGKYKVIARAFTMDLVASAPFSFEFDVAGAPFPWTTAALSVLLALALIALFWGYWQNRRIARTSAALMDANRQLAGARLQLANETEAERRRIARDLHDQTLADLRNLLLLTDQLPTNGGGSRSSGGNIAARQDQKLTLDPATFRAEIESISQEVRRICEDLSPSVLENVGLTAALEWALANALAHSAPDCKFEYEFTCADDLEEQMNLAPNVQMQIYRIAQEALSNICRHAGAKVVRLNVNATPDGIFLLKIEDDGRDFDPQDKKRKGGRGLANIRARASLIEAEVSWTRRTGGGTLFTLRKPNAIETQRLEAGG